MNYNDYQILSENIYNDINSQYKNNINTVRLDLANKLYNSILECFFCNFNLNNFNIILKTQIGLAKTSLEQIAENIYANFNIEKNKQKNIFNYNVFTFLEKLTNILNQLTFWQYLEEKEYYKNFLKNTINSTCFIIKNILNALNKSKTILFKYM